MANKDGIGFNTIALDVYYEVRVSAGPSGLGTSAPAVFDNQYILQSISVETDMLISEPI